MAEQMDGKMAFQLEKLMAERKGLHLADLWVIKLVVLKESRMAGSMDASSVGKLVETKAALTVFVLVHLLVAVMAEYLALKKVDLMVYDSVASLAASMGVRLDASKVALKDC